MNRVELKTWAKEKIKGHILELLIPIVIAEIVTTLQIGQKISYDGGTLNYSAGLPIGLLFYFVTVGLTYFLVKFMKDQEHSLKDLIAFSGDYVRTFLTGLLEAIFVFLWTLLLIIPGVVKGIAYSLIPFILADEKYKDMKSMDILKKSEQMMKGHKMDYFVLQLSFIGWHILAIFTLGLLEIWIIPYSTIASYKFLLDVKETYEANAK